MENLEQEIRKKQELVIEKLLHLGNRTDAERTSSETDQLAAFNRRDSGIENWDWPQGVGLYGLLKVMRGEGSERFLPFLFHWYDTNLEKGLPCRNINTTVPLLTMESLLDRRPDYEKTVLDWADWLMKGLPRTEEGGFQHVTSGNEQGTSVLLNEQQMWIDTLFMAVLFLNRAGQRYGREDWIHEAEHQILMHIKYLYDVHTGLFYHGWTFLGKNHFGGIFWCRGDSWFTAMVPDYLEDCGKGLDPAVRQIILDTYRAQVRSLVKLQEEDGLWHTVLDDGESYEETSGSAAIAAGMLKGIRTGLLDPGYEKPAWKAVRGILGKISEDGTVLGVSGGTGMGMNRDHYRNIMIAPMAYGQSLVILALSEALAAEHSLTAL